uniref:Uncharacterized protein n=1 Tax=Spirodela intermedia TaxID=51605 RepID=A0A8S0YB35_SPIIN
MVVGRGCPYRLVVQDISLSRRQRGFEFPGGRVLGKRKLRVRAPSVPN